MYRVWTIFNVDVPEEKDEDMSCFAGPIDTFGVFFFKLGSVAILWSMLALITLGYSFLVGKFGAHRMKKVMTRITQAPARFVFKRLLPEKLVQRIFSTVSSGAHGKPGNLETLEEDLQGAVPLLDTLPWGGRCVPEDLQLPEE
ncbi:hypothetical protein CYMTET_34614, partial [Cymbomonas tetramitiformis]